MRDAAQKTEWEKDGEEKERLEIVAANFARTEVDVAEIFCALAMNSRSPQRAERNRWHAQRALRAAVRALIHVSLDQRERVDTLRRAARIETLLKRSGIATQTAARSQTF
jgi:lipopolysaccharide biosynthesis regulator YciM